MVDAAPRTLALVDARAVVFDRTWSTTLPVVGSVSVELKILHAAPGFEFLITATLAGRSFNWSQDVSGNVTIPISLVAGFGLELDVTGWAASALQLSFDLLVKITGPFGFSVILFHDRVNIPLPGRDEVNALAAVEHGGADHAAAFMSASSFAPALTRDRGGSLEAFGGIDGGIQIKNPRLQGGTFCCDVRIFAKAFGRGFDETIPNLCVNVQTCATVFSGGFAGIDVRIDVCYHDPSHPTQACAKLTASFGPFSKTFEQCINL